MEYWSYNRLTLVLKFNLKANAELFKGGGRYHIETRANQWTGFYMITASFMKELSFWVWESFVELTTHKQTAKQLINKKGVGFVSN